MKSGFVVYTAALAMLPVCGALAQSQDQTYQTGLKDAAHFAATFDGSRMLGMHLSFNDLIAGSCLHAFPEGNDGDDSGPRRTECRQELPALYRRMVASKDFKPVTCDQWAMHTAPSWEVAKFDMQVHPYVSGAARQLRFEGQLGAADETRMLVSDVGALGSGDSAVIHLGEHTVMMRRADFKIGSVVHGYGTPAGAEKVENGFGISSKVLAIDAYCVEP